MGLAALSSSPTQDDYAFFAPGGRLLLRIEVKAKRDGSVTWATAWRRDHHLDGVPVMLATPEQLFCWSAQAPIDQTPDLVLDAVLLLSRYLTAITTGERIAPQVFKWVVGSWLQDVLAGDPQPVELGELGAWIRSFPRDTSLVSEVRYPS
jgi:hypothetical protein